MFGRFHRTISQGNQASPHGRIYPCKQPSIAISVAARPDPTVAALASTQKTAALKTLWSGQSAGLGRCTEATDLMTQLIAESDAFFLLAVAEKAFPWARSSMVYRC